MVAYRLRIVIISLLMLIMYLRTEAQQRFPVSGSIVINYPSSSMAEYASAFNSSIGLTLLLNDFNLSGQRVSLRFTIRRGNEIIAQSKAQLGDEPLITLQGGVQEQLQRNTVGYYFLEDNLNWQSSRSYSEALEEGNYTFSVQVSDYITGRVLSGSISQFFALIYNEPPLLNLPAPDAGIKAQGTAISPVYFQWTPRGQQISHTQYILTIKEIVDPGGNKDNQFLAASPYYTTAMPLSNTMLNYNPAGNTEYPPLQEGVLYGWQIRAVAENGYESAVVYKTDGYSPIRYFTYQSNCAVIEDFNIESKSSSRITINWSPMNEHTNYIVSYRKEGTEDWFYTSPVTEGYYNLAGLEAATTYTIRIGGACLLPQRQLTTSSDQETVAGQLPGHTIIYNIPKEGTTLADGQVKNIVCGQVPDIHIANQQLIENLNVNDVVKAGDFFIVLTRVSGNKEGWSGEGWTSVLPFGDVRWAVHYEGIKINTDKQLLNGAFETVYDAADNAIVDADEWIDNVKEFYNQIFDDEDAAKINEVVDKLLKDVVLPAELDADIKWAKENLQKALDELLKARKEYEEMPDEPREAKEEARKRLEKAEEKVAQAKNLMKTALENAQTFLDMFMDLLKAAIKDIAADSKTNFTTVRDKLKKESFELRDEPAKTEADSNMPVTNSMPSFTETPNNFLTKSLDNKQSIDTASDKQIVSLVDQYDTHGLAQRFTSWWNSPNGLAELAAYLKANINRTAKGTNGTSGGERLVDILYQMEKQGKSGSEKTETVKEYIYFIIGQKKQEELSDKKKP